jgi:protein O-GlcNAc transferase
LARPELEATPRQLHASLISGKVLLRLGPRPEAEEVPCTQIMLFAAAADHINKEQFNMNYYDYDRALQTLRCKQKEYESTKQRALSHIYNSLHDAKTALSLLQSFMHRYQNDATIYLFVNDISSRLQAYEILAESAPKALAHDRLNARCHFDFGTLLFEFPKSEQSLDIFMRYVNSTIEGQICIDNLSSQFDVCTLLNQIDANFQSEIEKTNSPENYIRLGNFLVFGRRFDKAEMAYRRATEFGSDCAAGYRNLSFVLTLVERLRESHVAMGHANFIQRRYSLAIESYVQALSFGEASTDIYENLARCYLRTGQFAEAAAVCAEAAVTTQTSQLYALWIDALRSTNQIDKALEVVERACAALPDDQYFKFQARLILPVIYKSEDDIINHRARFERTLHAWSIKCGHEPSYVSTNAINDIKVTNFYLPYQGQCDVDIHKEYGDLVHGIVSATYPKFSNRSACQSRLNKDRIRVGYISAYCAWHTVGKLFLGWLEHHDAQKFETYVYHLGREMDFISFKFEAACTKFIHLSDADLVEACERIRADQLDMLVFLEIGMDPTTAKIAALRLAPIQCVAWGHPVSSGLPTIDYFISNEMMEPSDGDNHYSEVLVRLPNIGVCVPQPSKSTSNRSRQDFGLSDSRTMYVFPHSLFKWLPRYDEVFARIAKRNTNSQFVFIERDTHSVEVAHLFKARVAEIFKRHDLDPDNYIRFVPELSTQNFLRLLSLADVYLDSIGWSGGMTTLEALGCMLPVVTMPGEFIRGRHSYGCLRRIGVMDTVAQNVEDYVDIAVRLGLDEKWREGIKMNQESKLHKLYDDTDCISGLEQFYLTLTIRESGLPATKKFAQ